MRYCQSSPAFRWADGKITSLYVTLFCKAQYRYPAICACIEGRAGKDSEGFSAIFPQGGTVRTPTSLCPPWPGPLQVCAGTRNGAAGLRDEKENKTKDETFNQILSVLKRS